MVTMDTGDIRLVALVMEEKSAPTREAQVNVTAKLRERNAGITATAMNGYAPTGHGNKY